MAVDDVSEVAADADDDVDTGAHSGCGVDDDAGGVDEDVDDVVLKVANGQAVHLVRSETFHHDVVETDTARNSGATGGGQRHERRLLVLKGRLKKSWAVHSLHAQEGQRRLTRRAPETKAEVTPVLQKHLGKAAILALDGACMEKCCAGTRASQRGIAHVFTPSSQLQKKDSDTQTTALLRNHSKGSQRLAREYQKRWTLAAGDNAAEPLLGHVEITGRRVQTIDRMAAAVD